MSSFQAIALLVITIWLISVIIRFRRSRIVLIGGLLVMGGLTVGALLLGWITLKDLGLVTKYPWWIPIGFALVGLLVMLGYSPLADRLASRWFPQPPTLEAFRPIQQSRGKLVVGILAAWALGGVLEELIARGIVLGTIQAWLTGWMVAPVAGGIAIGIAAVGAGLMHLYQGSRAVVIIGQLSTLLGLLFVVSGNNLWAVMLCHGLYDTIAFIRFASGKSRFTRQVKPNP